MEHHEARLNLGAYALGALEPADRQAVERHLDQCSACREELGALAAVRPLLDRLETADLAVADAELPSIADLTARLSVQRRREARRLRAWRVSTAAAAVVATVAVTLAAWPTGEDSFPSRQLAMGEVTAAGGPLTGEASATSWEWGTTVSLELAALPPREGYIVWVVADDGRREQAGSWGPTDAGGARVRGASRIATDDIARVEITDVAGLLLAVFEPVTTAA